MAPTQPLGREGGAKACMVLGDASVLRWGLLVSWKEACYQAKLRGYVIRVQLPGRV